MFSNTGGLFCNTWYFLFVEIPAAEAPVDYDHSELGMFRYEIKDYVSMTDEEDVVVGHTDFGWFSLAVFEDEGLEGLDRKGVWHSVPPIKDAIVVHVSDALEHLSGGIFRSFPHRVTPPKCDRQSLVYFFDPSMSCTMEPVDVPEEVKRLKDGWCDARWPLDFKPPMCYNDYVFQTIALHNPDGYGNWLVTAKN